mgnify:CR=1 FL=1
MIPKIILGNVSTIKSSCLIILAISLYFILISASILVNSFKMYDLLAPVEAGTKGIVEQVNDIGNLSIDWENGRTLSLVVGVDEFKVLEN